MFTLDELATIYACLRMNEMQFQRLLDSQPENQEILDELTPVIQKVLAIRETLV